ncbi:cytochrome P450 [Prauserella cavernicola]|uniref:Cytochrome P450 n=1 Tax=Prauserella cavernicola TaxID=2800127 RepID=A0A934V7V3_9PSEU|nr:cytochrome P450 [Prauserella cavernicola]MBK1787108.1 cytochrome P450 [Prauserella cavernicola]
MSQDIFELRSRHRRDYDPYSKASIQEHLDEIADRRRRSPVSYSTRGNGCWVLTTYDDISGVLRRNNRGFVSFPNDPDGLNVQGARAALIPIEIDGERHRQFRRVLDPLFSPGRVAALEPRLREAANALIDEFVEEGACEFVEHFAMPFPGATFLALMGWPAEDLPRLNRWVATVHHGVPGATEEESNAARAAVVTEMRDYVVALIADRRENPRDDVTTHCLQAEIEGRRLSDDELFDLFLLMMLAGLDTVQSVLAQSFAFFGRYPGRWAEMFDGPAGVEAAIEELLRWTAPAIPTRTVTDESALVGDVELPRGERVHFPLAAANRDPKYYPDPDSIVFDRPAKPHLAFGMGTHRCVGVHLARLELRVAFAEIRRRLPEFALAPGSEPDEHLGLSWGVENVHIVFPPGRREGRDRP